MKTLTAACAISMMTMLFSACDRGFTDRPEIESEVEAMRNSPQEVEPQTLEIKSEGESGKRAFLKVGNMKIWAERLSNDLPSGQVVLTGRVQILMGEGLLEEAYDDLESSVTVDVTEGSIVKRTGRFHSSSFELGSSRKK